MIKKELAIPNKLGLHARSAAMLVQEADRFKSEVFVSKEGREVNGKSVMGLMLLAAEYGAKVLIRIDGPDEREAMEAIIKLFKRCFDEKEG